MAGRGGNAVGAHFDMAPLGWEHTWPNPWCSGNVYITVRATSTSVTAHDKAALA